ncbi:heterokaryon incompatibility protein-domain-containing protein [Immersiella caudata]|uniref:Heterokaryon incompatibility protein-domain-containing protein n=1 Tax=Immersiella caudata TaxID=314043 RepID=A0AA39WFB2_9PEZI|nr:heterokaryon incompatibility protein-domain-containing protein [Immersiella caudata]
MSAIGLDVADSVTKISFNDRFEASVPDDTVVTLNKLCAPCTAFVEKSIFLKRLGRKDIKIEAEELGHVGTPRDLKAGYQSGDCHLCALLWLRAGGAYLEPGNPKTEVDLDAPLEVKMVARDVEKEYEIMVARETDKTKKLWYKIASMPPISDRGFLDLRITALIKDKVYADLHIHHSSNPKLNAATLGFTSSPISARHSDNYAQIKTWLDHCTSTHTRCRELPDLVSPTAQLPSRLLDVSDNAIKLDCSLPASDLLPYTTLSHMWGTDPSACPQLLLSTLESFRSSIDINDLPPKYAYAIHITRALGYRFIWIDSLCIIQDSAPDWQTEALKMAGVYGRSVLNISFVFPPDKDLRENYLRDPRVLLPCVTASPGKKKSDEDQDKLVISYRPGFHRPAWSPTVYKKIWPLLSRGWVFQERLLCSKTVYFGQDRLLWECCEEIVDEYYGPLTTMPGSKSHFHRVITGLAAGLKGVAEAAEANKGRRVEREKGEKYASVVYDEDQSKADEQWGPLARDYRAGELTKEFDRGIAFAGIARAIQSSAGVTYLAGLWKELFAFDLLWTTGLVVVSDEEREKSEKRKLEAKPAPSWSWFSVVPTASKMGGDVLGWPFRTNMQVYKRHALFEAEVLAFKHPKGGSLDVLLHDFDGMSVTLKAKKVQCGFEWWDQFDLFCVLPFGDVKWVMGKNENVIAGQAVTPRVLQYAHDDATVKNGDVLPQGAHMVLTVEQAWHVDPADPTKKTHGYVKGKEIPDGWTTSYQYAGIVVVPAEGETWRRIGAFMLFDNITGHELVGPFDEVAEEDIVLV